MAYLISLALIFSISLAVNCNQFEKSLDVPSLNSSNFDEFLKTYDYLLVFFYTPSSHQARKLFNEYSRAATHFKEDHSKNVAFAKVDASIEKDLVKRFNIVGFPAIDFFIQGVSIPFKGGRSKDSIVDWLDKKIQTQAVLVKKLDTLTELQSDNDVVVLGLFKNVEQDGHAEFNKVVKAVDNIKFAVTYEKSIFEKLNINNEKSLVIFKNFDEGRNVYDESEPFEADKIKKFINSNQLPTIIEFNNENLVKITSCDIHVHILLFLDKKKDDVEAHLAVWKNAAQVFKGKVIFGYIDIDLPESDGLLGFFEVKREQTPIFRLLSTNDMSKHSPDFNEIDADLIKNFVNSFLDGSLPNKDIDFNSIIYELKSVDDLKSLRKESFLVIGLFKDQNGEKASIYNDLIKQQSLKDIKFASSSEKKVFDELKVKEDDSILVLKKNERMPHYFRGKFELAEIKKFIKLKSLPNVIDLDQKNSLMLNELGVKRINVLFASKKSGMFERVLGEFEEASKHFLDKVVFALVDADLIENERIMDGAKLTRHDLPTVRFFSAKESFSKVFNPEYAEIRKEDIVNYVQQFLDEMGDDEDEEVEDDKEDDENDDGLNDKKDEL